MDAQDAGLGEDGEDSGDRALDELLALIAAEKIVNTNSPSPNCSSQQQDEFRSTSALRVNTN